MPKVTSATLSVCMVASLALNLALLATGHGVAGIVGHAIAVTLGLVWAARTIEALSRREVAPPTTASVEWSHCER